MCLFRCLSFAYQWCSAPHSSPLCIHISHLYKCRAPCNGDDTHAGHTPLLSTLLRSDTLRQCTPRECHSRRSTLLGEEKKKDYSWFGSAPAGQEQQPGHQGKGHWNREDFAENYTLPTAGLFVFISKPALNFCLKTDFKKTTEKNKKQTKLC